MVPCQVIEDSDEDDVSFLPFESLIPPVITNEVDTATTTQPTSTDPKLFRTVYEEHFGPLAADDQLSYHKHTPIIEDPTVDQRTSSANARKLKRGKTVNTSSLSSISEPTLSRKRDRCAESRRSLDHLTQITTPRTSKEAIQKALWEVPTSSASEPSPDVHVEAKDRYVKTTYGRQSRRAQTVTHITHCSSVDQTISSSLEDDVLRAADQNKSAEDQEDNDTTISRPKRCKTGLSLNVDLPEPLPTEVSSTNEKEISTASCRSAFTSVGSTSAQVQRSTNNQIDMDENERATGSVHSLSNLSFIIPAKPEPAYADYHSYSESASTRSTGKSLSSILIPNSLSDEQKLQYEVISVATTSQGRPSSQPETPEVVNLNIQNTEDMTTLPDSTSPSNLPVTIVQHGAPAIVLPSSPLVSVSSRKAKRAKSEICSKQVASLTASSHQNKVTKRKGRSRTFSQGEKRSNPETAIDELSWTFLEPIGIRSSKEAPSKMRRKKLHSEDRQEETSADELRIVRTTEEKKQQYQHRLDRQTDSVSMKASKDDSDFEASSKRTIQRKSSEAIHVPNQLGTINTGPSSKHQDQASVTRDTSAATTSTSKMVIDKDFVKQTENSDREQTGSNHDTAQKLVHMPVCQSEGAPKASAQVKKRTGKKAFDFVAPESTSTSEIQSSDSVLVTSKDEIQRKVLREIGNNNKQPSQETATSPAPPAATTSIPQPAQTPNKGSKKGTDQHSPLHSGKVPYRVGLSKKTKIAPLLKMVKK